MSEQRMDVYLLAAPQPGIERSALVSNLAAAFKKDVPSIEKMLRRSRTLVKADVGPELAAKYKALIEKAGGQCELVNHGQAAELQITAAPKVQSLALEPMATPKPAEDEDDYDQTEAACFCVKCGTMIRTGLTHCPKCFTPVTQDGVSKSKTTATLLAFFLGGLGVHRLYLGQWWGVFYLLFWGTLIPSIVSLIESIVFLCTSQKSWDEKYGNVKKTSGVLIAVFIICIFVFIAITGILAAVALPAYQDYVNRAKTQSAMPLVLEAQKKVEIFIKKNHSYPNENILVGLPDEISSNLIESIYLQEKAKLQVTYKFLKDKNTIIWAPKEVNGDVVWTCNEGTMNVRYRPEGCRDGHGADDSSTNSALPTPPSELNQKVFSDDKRVSIQVPDSWKKQDLVAGAAIGLAQGFEQNYVVVMVDSKVDFEPQMTLDKYAALVKQQMEANSKNGVVEQQTAVKLAGLPAQRFIFQSSVEGVKIAYVVTLVESDKSFCKIMAWTLQSRLDNNRKILEDVSNSVRFQ